jgi:hypothetical protein
MESRAIRADEGGERSPLARLKRGAGWVVAVSACVGLASCVWIRQGVQVQALDPVEGTVVTTPVKAHLADGSTVVYVDGVTIDGNALRGSGDHYNLALTDSERVFLVSLDDVVAMESFRTKAGVAESVLVSTLATAGTVAAASAVVLALFGSCPTVYSADGTVEEAELFSSSIGPLFEARDIDRLMARPDSDGVLTLEVRNEAMETHYINNLQLLEVVHAAGRFVLPDAGGRPIVVGDLRTPDRVRDRAGRDVSEELSDVDGVAYLTDPVVIRNADEDDLLDWLDFTVPVPAGAEEIALVFRMRNSLLSTVLLYDVMLGPMGAEALDWIGSDLGEISTAVELGRWLEGRAGLHVSVRRGGRYEDVARVPDPGPISWHDVGVRIPVARGETALEVRLRFMPDHFRIDRLGIAMEVGSGESRTIEVAGVTDLAGRGDATARERILATDEEYLETRPGQHFFAHFDVGPETPGRERTFLLSSLGYYIEWVRGDWIRQTRTPAPEFAPSDRTLVEALRRWQEVRDEFEERFRLERVPVGGA